MAASFFRFRSFFQDTKAICAFSSFRVWRLLLYRTKIFGCIIFFSSPSEFSPVLCFVYLISAFCLRGWDYFIHLHGWLGRWLRTEPFFLSFALQRSRYIRYETISYFSVTTFLQDGKARRGLGGVGLRGWSDACECDKMIFGFGAWNCRFWPWLENCDTVVTRAVELQVH